MPVSVITGGCGALYTASAAGELQVKPYFTPHRARHGGGLALLLAPQILSITREQILSIIGQWMVDRAADRFADCIADRVADPIGYVRAYSENH